tara:strand:- start:61 stop:996 length:936 start_codon:yes stop_codon:yes gene_type:complete
MKNNFSIFISGEDTLIGKSLANQLKKNGYKKIIKTNKLINLCSLKDVDKFFKKNKPQYVIVASGKSGGIKANLKFPANLMIDNLLSQTNIIHTSYKYKVKKLLFIASSCVYPRDIQISSSEKDLFSGKLETSNQSYSIAKLSGIELCRAYRIQHKVNFFSVIPTNIYGPGEDFNKQDNHVIPSLIKQIYEAKQKQKKSLKLIGTGKTIREFIYVDDFSSACIKLIRNKRKFNVVNIGSGKYLKIYELANIIKDLINYNGKIIFSSKKYDGSQVKKLNFDQMKNIGWKANTSLKAGLEKTFNDFKKYLEYDR